MSPLPLPVGGFKITDWVVEPPTSTSTTGPPFVDIITDWITAETVVHNVDGSPFVDTMIVSAGIRGPAGVVVIAADQELPPEGTPAGTIVYRRVD